MTWSQTIVVLWLQFAVAAAVLLAIARIAMRWIVQPAERIRLIQVTLAGAIATPLLMAFVPLPAWRLEVISAAGDAAPPQKASVSPEPSTLRVPLDPPLPSNLGGTASWPLGEPTVDDSSAHRSVPAAERPLPPTISSDATGPSVRDMWLVAAILIVLVYGIAAAYFLAEWIVGVWRLSRLVQSAAPASLAVRQVWEAIAREPGRRVRLLVSRQIATPLAFGWPAPTVVVPQHVAAEGGQALEYCLAHEWTHIRRGDLLTWHATWLCQFVLWQQPLFWSLRKELRICQDILADSAASGNGAGAVEYSELLVRFARLSTGAALPGALTFLDHPSQLMRRVTMLLSRPFVLRSACTWKFSLAAGVAAVLVCGLCTAVRLDTARAASEEPAAESSPSNPPKKDNAEQRTAEEKSDSSPTAKTVPAYEQPAHLTYQCMMVDKETGRGVPNAKVIVERSDSSIDPWPFKQIAKSTHVTDSEGKYTVEIPPEQSGLRSLYIQLSVEHDEYVDYAGGYSLSMIRKNETVGERPFFERLKLQPAEHITGKVVSPTAEPLAGVTLVGFTTMKAGDVDNLGWLKGTTQADGSFRLNMMKGGVAFVWALPNDYAIVQRFVDHKQPDLGDVRVPEGIRLSGRALSAEGKPVGGIAVNAFYQGPENEPLQPYNVLSGIRRGVMTDAEGRFTFDPLPPGEYRVVPEDELHDPRHERGMHVLPGVFIAQKTTLQEGAAPAELELQAVPHINFHARYLDSQGNKQKGHEFFIHGQMDGQFWSTRARPDSEGAVTVQLPHGLQDVQLGLVTNEHSALRHRKGTGMPIENHNYNVRLGTLNDDVEGFEIIRYKAPLVVVKAVDEAGQAIEKYEVVGHYAWMKDLTNYVATTTGSHVSFGRQKDGHQRTEQLLPDEEVTFTVTAAGYDSATQTLKVPEGETKELVLTLKKSGADKPAAQDESPDAAKDAAADTEDKTATNKPAANGDPPTRLTYECVVVDKVTGKGIPQATVVVRRSQLSPRDNQLVEETLHTTDESGRYTIEIPPEQAAMRYLYIELDVAHETYAAKKGFGYALSMIRKNETLGERPFFERVELEAADFLTGKLLSPSGQPLAGVKLLGYSKRNASDFRDYGSFTDAVSQADGTFRLNLVKGGVGVYWILPKDFAIVQKFVGNQRPDQGEIRLKPGIRVTGQVLGVDGQPLAGVAVNIDLRDREDLNELSVASSVGRGAISDREGRIAFDPLPPGDYRVIPDEHLSDPLERDRTVYPVPGVFLPQQVSLKEGAAAPLVVQAVPHVDFRAQYLNSKGEKTGGHAIHIFGQIDNDYWFGQGRPDPQGTIALRVPHGLQNVRVQLMTNEHGSLRFRRGPEKPLENREGDLDFGTLNDDVEGLEIIRYQAPIALVKPVDEAGQPVPGAKVTAAYSWGKQQYVLEGEARSDLSFEKQKDGRFRSSQLLPDEEVTYTASAEGYESATDKLKLPEGETKDLVLTLKKTSAGNAAGNAVENKE
jgi:beta-lactamase regulating signal transducer with metallopeptidase domain/protocatechuate 3,4-dioxygenase beta subunit